MRHSAYAAWAVLLLFGLAGCAGNNAQPASLAEARGAAEIVPSHEAIDTGGVNGIVVDDEFQPIDNASVSLLDLEVEILTLPDGSFNFTGVPVGEHTISAGKPGYEGQVRKVESRSRVSTEVQFTLNVLEVKESYFEVYPNTALHHFGIGIYPTWYTTLSGYDNLCEGCVWTINATSPPDFLMLEITGAHTVSIPTDADAEHFWVKRENGDGNVILEGEPALPSNMSVNKTMIGKTKLFWIQLMCQGYYNPCYEERRETWTTLFFNMPEIPEGYSARPPD